MEEVQEFKTGLVRAAADACLKQALGPGFGGQDSRGTFSFQLGEKVVGRVVTDMVVFDFDISSTP